MEPMTSHTRHPRAIEPGPGQESVWGYPRPPRLERSDRTVLVRADATLVAQTTGAYRVLETSHPPTWYVPPADIEPGTLTPSTAAGTVCEWKGPARYWDVHTTDGSVLPAAAWSYPDPTPAFRAIAGYVSFYPALLHCEVDGELVRPQEGGFYGGWVTAEIVGPFKGGPGSWGW